MTAVADIRNEGHYESVICIFIEGIGTVWTTDAGARITGSGAASWIGLSEQDVIDDGGSDEVVGQRTVVTGLDPKSIRPFLESVNVRSGGLHTDSQSFKILDLDGTLATLFATKGKTYDVLAEYIPANTTALSTSINTNNLGGTVNPRGKNIGIERIGPSGERRFFPCFPGFALPGPEHFWNNVLALDPGLPRISDDPIQFAGRRVAVYEIVRDRHTSSGTEASKWPVWKDQHAGGGLVWYGVLEDAGQVGPDDMWTIRCRGKKALLQKPLGLRTNMENVRIGATLNLRTDLGHVETKVGVYLTYNHVQDNTPFGYLSGTFDGFDLSPTLTATTKQELISEITTILANAASGTGTDISGTAGDIQNASESGFSLVAGDLKMTPDGRIHIQKEDSSGHYKAMLVMHAKAWRSLGFEPEVQKGQLPLTNEYGIEFAELGAGQVPAALGASAAAPGPGYWAGVVTTIRLNETDATKSSEVLSNDANWRTYRPLHSEGIQVLSQLGEQDIYLSGSGSDWYCQGTVPIGWDGEDVGDGYASNRAGYLVFKGKIRNGLDGEPEDLVGVALCEWRNTLWNTSTEDDGQINSQDTDGRQAIRIVRWLDPRTFGYPHRRLDRDWSFTPGDDGNPIEITPLASYAIFQTDEPEYLDATLMSVLVSTGSGTGFDGPVGGGNLPSFSAGSNDPDDATGTLNFHGDIWNASLGLAIPEELVTSAESFRDAFPGSASDAINRGRIAWEGMIQAEDLLRGITEARRIGWTTHGGQLGVRHMGTFGPNEADEEILEADLSGKPEDPTSVIPTQELRATGQIDYIDLSYRYSEGGTALERTWRAEDPGFVTRSGKLRHPVEDWGLTPLDWYSSDAELTQVTTLQSWANQFRELWALEAAEYFASRHFMVKGLKVFPQDADNLGVLSRVRLTNPWVMDAAGTRGVTAHTGLVTKLKRDVTGEAFILDILLFEDGGGTTGTVQPHYAPVALVKRWDSSTKRLYVYTDFRTHGQSTLYDLTGFAKPAWASALTGGGAKVHLWPWAGATHTDGSPKLDDARPENTVSSVNDGSDGTDPYIEMTGDWSSWTGPDGVARTTLLQNLDYFVTLTGVDHADTPQWAKDLFGHRVDETLQTSGGTVGRIFLP